MSQKSVNSNAIYIAFEWLLKLETNVRGCRITLKTFYQHPAMEMLAPNFLIKGNLILIIFTQNIKGCNPLKRILPEKLNENTFEWIATFNILSKNYQN